MTTNELPKHRVASGFVGDTNSLIVGQAHMRLMVQEWLDRNMTVPPRVVMVTTNSDKFTVTFTEST